jgi:predicted GIY-YIG superfamily endonuclease
MGCIGSSGPSICRRSAIAIAHEKRVKRWRREWKFALIERGNPEWQDLFDTLV